MLLVPKIVVFVCISIFFVMGLTIPVISLAADYSFNLEEFEKKSFSWGGHAELKWSHNSINQDSAFGLQGDHDNLRSDLDRLTSSVQLSGNYNKASVDFNWLLQASTQKDQLDSEHTLDIFSAYISMKPAPAVIFEVGKKTFKWGKGYAWNPVGFIDRPKDPNNPEDALEGYTGIAIDLIKSFPGTLQTLALTGVVVPVWDSINADFGATNHLNLAAKLYLLYRDTDIDFIFFTGGSRSTRYGIDFAKNLATNFAMHAELAYIPKQNIKLLNNFGMLENHEISVTSYLLGLRYLTETDITTIIEFYHNGASYSEAEMDRFYQLVSAANTQYDSSKSGYAKPQAGRNYIYVRVTQKEPFELLYFTPGISAIINLDDESYTISPEVVYSGFTNWEVRLRYSQLEGSSATEFGEKLNERKLELHIRYYF